MDAAAKVNQSVSINETLLTGPDLLAPLITILWNFRRKKIAFSGDIKEMFHQVRIRKEDRVAQRFPWRDMDRNIEPEVYEMQAMIFGSVCFPSIAQFVKNFNAKEFQNRYPEAFTAIVSRHYVDDYLDCCDTEEDAIKLIEEVREVQQKGGFELCNWICSSRSVLEKIPEELRAKNWKDLQNERVLGIHWNPELDVINFVHKSYKIGKENGRPTKRLVLKTVMEVFDPCGFLGNITIKLKILLQDIWRSRLGWDDEISEQMNKRWSFSLSNLEKIRQISIPRCYFLFPYSTVQLHIFCAASEKAYAAVAYIRTSKDNGFESTLVTSKTRVAPLKPVTIPRLELKAAVMASRIGKCLESELELHISSTHYLTDSKTVLYWIKGDA